MKAMTCRQLGGACDEVFRARSFEEIAEMSKHHGMKMFQLQDEAHRRAMSEMQKLAKTSELMKAWYETKKKEFEALAEE